MLRERSANHCLCILPKSVPAAVATVVFCLLLLVSTAISSPAAEFRGAWVTAWESGFLTPAEADETIRAAKAANMNALFIQVRKVGDAYYQSGLEPRATNIRGSEDYDPLAYVIRRAHAEGLEVHAWVNVLRVQSAGAPSADYNHVCNAHPEWLTCDSAGRTKSAEGMFLDPGAPEAREYTVRIVQDIASKYNVDGIHLDYIRYPGKEWGYNAISVDRFNARYGRNGLPASSDPLWEQWRRDQMTSLVRSIYSEVASVDPDMKVTIAAISWGECSSDFRSTEAYKRVYQDWAGWMREGIIDASIPMNYRDEGSVKAADQYRRWLTGMQRWQYGRHIYGGQMVAKDVSAAVVQLRATRSSGLGGMVCFRFNATPERNALVAALRRTVYAAAADTPSMPWKDRYARIPSRSGTIR